MVLGCCRKTQCVLLLDMCIYVTCEGKVEYHVSPEPALARSADCFPLPCIELVHPRFLEAFSFDTKVRLALALSRSVHTYRAVRWLAAGLDVQ